MAIPTLIEKTWDKTGRSEFVTNCQKYSSEETSLRKYLYQCCQQVITGQLKNDSFIAGLVEVINALNTENINRFPTMFTDILLLCDVETQIGEKRERDNYIRFLAGCCNKVIADFMLKERLDYDTLAEAEIIVNKRSATTKFIKLKTRLFYKQQKFNLFREESEGYSKLITELLQPDGFKWSNMVQYLRSLTGCFSLDPNRVLDVVLECFECRPYLHASYIPLLKNFLNNSSTLSQMIAFKFGFYQSEHQRLVTPSSLYDVTAILLHESLLQLDSIYPYLSPNDKSICDFYQKELSDARTAAKRLIPSDDKMDEDMTENDRHLLVANNQKLGLCLALLKIGDWTTCKRLIDHLPEFYVVSKPEITRQMCSLVHYTIDIFYLRESGLPSVIMKKISSYKCEAQSRIKQAETIDDLRAVVFPMIEALGSFLYIDTLLITKIIRIGRSLILAHGDEMKYDLLNILNEAILPAVSLIESNSGLADELWQFLRCFPYSYRYRLYSNWKAEPSTALMIRMRADTMKRVRYIMKRLSKDNVKFSGRQIGKLSHSNPSFVFEYMLTQVQNYDNLIGPVVDSLKFLTSLSYDVLIFCTIEALSNSKRERTMHDGATVAPWLLSLANFCGSVVKKYTVELPGLLQFIANQLKAEKSLDLLILKEIIQKMAGIETSDVMTDEHLAAMSGGELLRAEGGYFNQVRNTRKSSTRLKESLLETNLAMPLCIMMAQQRNCILYNEQEHSNIKLVGKLYDQCQETLVQYGSFLSGNLSIDDYIGRLPSLAKLITEYHLSADIAFFLCRPMIIHHINLKFEEIKKSNKHSDWITVFVSAWEQVTKPQVEAIVPAFSSKTWEVLSPRFFVTFWTLSMYDLEVPKSSYAREVGRLKSQIQMTDENKEMVASKKKKEIERCRLLMERLIDEQQRQVDHVDQVKQRLDKEKDQWFPSTLYKVDMTTQFLQHCLFPRCIFTAQDALYCARFVKLLHFIEAPNFSTLICFDRIFGDISYTMSSCTETEANHYGRFLCAIQEIAMRWHKDKTVFEAECAKYTGFVTKFSESQTIHVDYEQYRHLCHKWHYRLTKAFIYCLDSSDYVQIRNALIVLTKLLPFFPLVISFAQVIEKRVDVIRTTEKEKRPDLYALATGYSGQLKARKSFFVHEHEFHEKAVNSMAKGDVSTNSGITKKENKPENSSGAPSGQIASSISSSTHQSSNSFSSSSHNTNNGAINKSPTKDRKDNIQGKLKSDIGGSETDSKKKDGKMEVSGNSTRIKRSEDKSSKSDRNHLAASDKSTSKNDSKSSANNSPRRSTLDYATSRNDGVNDGGDGKDHKRRKIESRDKSYDNDRDRESYERRRGGEDSTSSSPSTLSRPHDKKRESASRKRDNLDDIPSDNVKRKKDEDNVSKSKKVTDDRDSVKKPSERRSSSRKKTDDK